MYKILLVDDSKTMLYTFDFILKENFSDIEVFLAYDPIEAIALLEKTDIDLVISDVYMPKMDGFEFAKYLSEHEKTKSIPLILTSAVRKEEADKLISFENGAIDFVEKPINETLFLAKLRVFFKLISAQKAQKQMMELQSRQEAMKEMISMVAHQWRQPLSALSTSITTLRLKKTLGKLDDAYFEKAMNNTEKIVQELSQKIQDFYESFNAKSIDEEEELEELLKNGWELQSGRAHDLGVTFVFTKEGEENFLKKLNKESFNQVIFNIYANAMDAFERNKEGKKSLHVKLSKNSERFLIEIADNAGGIEKEIIHKIFEPYFSTKSKNARGMGLYLAKNLVENVLHGEIKVENKDGGASFLLSL